jgi:hypothetical protein
MCIIVAQKTFLLRGVNKLLTVDVAEPTAPTAVTLRPVNNVTVY